jgi:ankyrin repeat protein
MVSGACAGVDAPDEQGWTPLHHACAGFRRQGQRGGGGGSGSSQGPSAAAQAAEMVSVLLDGGVARDSIARDGCAPIHRAAARASLPLLNVLLRQGANPNAANALRCVPVESVS